MNPFAGFLRRPPTAWVVAGLLGVDPEAIRLGPLYHYRPFTVAKPDGRERRVLAPSPALKRLQRRLLDEYLAPFPVHPCATAFHPGGSTVRHARAHALSEVVATVDLRDFFESTRAARVQGFFRAQGWHGPDLRALMRLCTYNGGLPQGAPTSPCLSNLVNARLDERLQTLARNTGATYTRYADDLAFSWRSDIFPSSFPRAVEDALSSFGYEIQPNKPWRVTPTRARPTLTGITLLGDGRLRTPLSFRLNLTRLRWRAWWHNDPADRERLRGCLAYTKMVER